MVNREKTGPFGGAEGPVLLLLHPIVGCLEEETALFELLKGVELAGVLAEEAPFWADSPAYPDLWGGRYRGIARSLAARRSVPLITMPCSGLNHLLRAPLRGLEQLRGLWDEKRPVDWGHDTPAFLPVGFPPEELRTAEENGARAYCGGQGAWGIAMDWLCRPQRLFRASWQELCAPLFGAAHSETGYREFPDMPRNCRRGELLLSGGGVEKRIPWNNEGKTDHTNSSRLYYTGKGCKLVLKSARVLMKDNIDRRGPEYAEKLFRLTLLESILTRAGVRSALPIRLLSRQGHLSGFLMYDVSEQSRDMSRLTLREDRGGCTPAERAKALEDLCICIAFYQRLGIYCSDMKSDNFYLLRDRVIPIDADGFSVVGGAASLCQPKYRRPGREEYGAVPYYHSAGNEDFSLASLLFLLLRGSPTLPGSWDCHRDLPEELRAAFDRCKTRDPLDAADWAELLHRCRLALEQGSAPAPQAHRPVLCRPRRWERFRIIEAEPCPGRLTLPLEIRFDHG